MSKFLSSQLEYKEEKSFWTIAFCVVFLHFLGLWAGTFWSTEPPKKNLTQRVVVSTISLNPQVHTSPQRVPSPAPAPLPLEKKEQIILSSPKEEAPAVQKTVQEVPKKTPPPPPPKPIEKKPEVKGETQPKVIPPKPVEKKETPKPKQEIAVKPAPPKKNVEEEKKKEKAIIAAKEAEKVRSQEIAALQEASRKNEQALFAKAKENLAKMAETRNPINTSPSVKLDEAPILRPISQLKIDALPGEFGAGGELSTSEVNYRNEVAGRLKSALRLPDYGAVKIKLTLDRSGKVTQVEVISSESQKNKLYVEKTLLTLLFPNFGTHFKGAAQYTFLVTLNNE
jgi:colicin import membrane protein